MGGSSSAHFNAFQKERLGWLNYGASPPLTTVTASGTYWLEAYEPASVNTKALKILKSNGTYYYVEYRAKQGFDSSSSSGVLLHTGVPSNGDSSYLWDLLPTSSSVDRVLDVGQSFSDATAGVTITTMSVSSTGATVAVSFDPLACVRANPALTLTPSQSQWVQPGSTVTFTVAVTNNDNAGCTASTFALQAAAPSGWTATFTASALTLSPGASASTTLQVTSPATAAGGFYPIGVTVTNSANPTATGTATATVVLVSGLNVTVSTDQASYTRGGQAVSITTGVSANDVPTANVSVTVTITKANGTVVTQQATTGTAGTAVTKLQLKKPDPVGTYQVRVDVTINGIVGSATTSFTVQ